MSEKEYTDLKTWLKWIVPKVAGVGVLVLQCISSKGQLPHTRQDWIWVMVGVGIAFASNKKKP